MGQAGINKVILTLEFPGLTLGAGQREQTGSLPPCQPQPGWAAQPQISPQSPQNQKDSEIRVETSVPLLTTHTHTLT